MMLVCDPWTANQIIAERREAGVDRFDEVWDGVYVVSPLRDDEHQHMVGEIATVLMVAFKWPELARVYMSVGISDRKEGWEQNYRVPDISVFLNDTAAESCKTHWYGGPDFAIEITSPGEHALEKLPFYAKVGTRELLIIDRHPWALTLYRLQDGELLEVGKSTLDDSNALASEVLPLTWRLIVGEAEPAIEIVHRDGKQRWVVEADTE